MSFRIPWTKTTKSEGASVILTARSDTLCPRRALENHLAINNDVPGSAALFAYRTESGGHKNMLKQTFLAFVMSIWQTAHLAHVLGHSFRIGGAGLARGFLPTASLAISWSSEGSNRYAIEGDLSRTRQAGSTTPLFEWPARGPRLRSRTPPASERARVPDEAHALHGSYGAHAVRS